MRLLEIGLRNDIPCPANRTFTRNRFSANDGYELAFHGKYAAISRSGDSILTPVSNVTWFVPVALPVSGPEGQEADSRRGTSVPSKAKNKARSR